MATPVPAVCIHEWTGSALRLVVQPAVDWVANVFPTAPPLVRVEHCGLCGLLRLPPDVLALWNKKP